MGNYKACAALEHLGNSLLNKKLRLSINTRGCLVQNQNARITEHGTRKGNQLSLSVAQLSTAGCKLCVVTVRQFADKIICVNGAACSQHFFFTRIQLAIHNIFTDCAAENIVVLCHNSHLGTQTRKLYITNVFSVNQDGPVLNIIKTAHQINYRRFTSARRSYKSNCFALSHREINIFKNIYIFFITEGNVLKVNLSLDCRHLLCILAAGNHRLLINNFKNTLSTAGRINKLVVKVTQIHNRLPEHSHVASKGNVSSNGNAFNSKQLNSYHIQRHGSNAPAQINPGTKAVAPAYCAEKLAAVIPNQLLESLVSFLLGAEALNNLNARKIFVYKGIHIRRLLTFCLPVLFCHNRNQKNSANQKRQTAEGSQSQLPVFNKHNHHYRNNRNKVRN